MKGRKIYLITLGVFLLSSFGWANEISVKRIKGDLSKAPMDENVWKKIKAQEITLVAQPMIAPRPEKTETNRVSVRAVHDGKWVAFRLEWADQDKSEGGKTGEYSDGVAIQFPANAGSPPPVFMGAKGAPVHIYHWRAQYQRDKDFGKRKMKDLYPNMNTDIYPMDFPDQGNLKNLTQEKKEAYNPGIAVGNPQSYRKTGVDEILAEGFGSSSVWGESEAQSFANWKKRKWSVVISRPLKSTEGSSLIPGEMSYMAFAVWQGNKGEVGSRKSVTMTWTPVKVEKE